VSNDFPFNIAAIDAPLPKWQVIILELLMSKPKNSQAFSATYL
jgi:hypothetical protein